MTVDHNVVLIFFLPFQIRTCARLTSYTLTFLIDLFYELFPKIQVDCASLVYKSALCQLKFLRNSRFSFSYMNSFSPESHNIPFIATFRDMFDCEKRCLSWLLKLEAVLAGIWNQHLCHIVDYDLLPVISVIETLNFFRRT